MSCILTSGKNLGTFTKSSIETVSSMYAHLHTHSPFSFLDGAASIESLLTRAAEIGCSALAITDHNNLSAAVRFHKLAAAMGIKPIQGCEITLDNGCHLTLLCQNRTGYTNLCRLVTRAHLDAPRGLPLTFSKASQRAQRGPHRFVRMSPRRSSLFNIAGSKPPGPGSGFCLCSRFPPDVLHRDPG